MVAVVSRRNLTKVHKPQVSPCKALSTWYFLLSLYYVDSTYKVIEQRNYRTEYRVHVWSKYLIIVILGTILGSITITCYNITYSIIDPNNHGTLCRSHQTEVNPFFICLNYLPRSTFF